jgi:hypothetical protein
MLTIYPRIHFSNTEVHLERQHSHMVVIQWELHTADSAVRQSAQNAAVMLCRAYAGAYTAAA